MPKSPKQNKQVREQRFQELSEAALTLFARKGFSGTKVNDISTAAHLSHGLFYHYFHSKEDAYVIIVHDILDMFLETVNQIENTDQTPYGKLHTLTEYTFSISAQTALKRHLLIMGALHADFLCNDKKETILALYAESLHGIARIIEAGQQDGTFKAGVPLDLASYYMSISQGLTLWNAKDLNPISVSTSMVINPILAIPTG